MPSKIMVPELGESVLEATVGRWLKKVGESVAVGEPLVELETEKVDLEVGAEKGGTLSRIEKQQGEDVKIGDVLGIIDESAGTSFHPATQPSPGNAEPKSSESRSPARESKPEPKPGPTPVGRSSADSATEVGATPSARQVARERGVNLEDVALHGKGGRVTAEDVESYVEEKGRAASGATPPGVEPAEGGPKLGTMMLGGGRIGAAEPARVVAPPATEARPEERVRMSRRRQTIARRLVEAQHTAAMLTTFNEVDMTAVMQIRKRWKEPFKQRHGVGLGIVSFFVKASIGALREFPELNSELQDDEIVLKRYYDLGIAVGAAGGLVVPVLRDADRLSFADIERAIKGFAEKAESGALTLDDLRGGTFTITNGGVFGSLMSTPILNPPQVGILGLHKIQERPVSLQGQIVSRPMMYVALSYDHRVVDGREAVQFLVRVKELVEDPASLMLEA
ncbi:MAG TPA: 2-oxoglutarate dehydrogenase complex dihydrolipoyllysine-residue succinyltransferase [Terriglobia bacterium]|nr:2-oxoglutarate dehydrogenase complex dihydrolipoyllysine-residue succinyltransferase [Terriglobia bacterium]